MQAVPLALCLWSSAAASEASRNKTATATAKPEKTMELLVLFMLSSLSSWD